MADLHANGGPVGKWQVRIRSEEPTLIEYAEPMWERTMRPVMQRCYELSRRTSYMVEGPNREVWFAIDRWNSKRGEWQNICQGKSRLRKGAPAWGGSDNAPGIIPG